MNKYIIISIILCLIIIYLYLKKLKNENFEVSSTGIDVVQNLTNLYIDPNMTITFNNINANSVTAETMNNNLIPLITPREPLVDGSIMRLGDKVLGNGWRNYALNTPSYLSMVFSATLGRFYNGTTKNLLSKEAYVQSDIAGNPSDFTFAPEVSSGMNKFITFYGPFDEVKRLSGLKYDVGLSAIIGFDPKKTYKIDCNVTLYYTQSNISSHRFYFYMKNDDRSLAHTEMTAHHGAGMTHAFRLVTTCTGITFSGIQICLVPNRGDPADTYIQFWGSGEEKGQPNTNFTIMIEEIRKGL
jgi:hypothetical protein